MAIESPVAKQQFFDANGNPLVGGKLYIYEAGTTTPATTWTDKLQTAANANPIILDSRGECVIWLDTESAYKYVLKTALDVEVYSVDNVNVALAIGNLRTDLAADDGSSLIGYIAEGTGAVATTVQSKLRESVSVKDFGAVGDGVTDDTAAIQAALNHATSATPAKRVVFPAGSYLLTSAVLSAAITPVYWGAEGDATLLCAQGIGLSGTQTALTLSASTAAWQSYITVSDASGVSVGDIIFLSANVITESYRSEAIKRTVARVASVVGTTINLDAKLVFPFATTDSGMAVTCYKPRTVDIEGLSFVTKTGNYNNRAITLTGVADCVGYRNCSFETELDLSGGLDCEMIQASVNVNPENCKYASARYGAMRLTTRNCALKGGYAYKVRHLTYPAYWAMQGEWHDLTTESCFAGLDCHSSFTQNCYDSKTVNDAVISNWRSSGAVLRNVRISLVDSFSAESENGFLIAPQAWSAGYTYLHQSFDVITENVYVEYLSGLPPLSLSLLTVGGGNDVRCHIESNLASMGASIGATTPTAVKSAVIRSNSIAFSPTSANIIRTPLTLINNTGGVDAVLDAGRYRIFPYPFGASNKSGWRTLETQGRLFSTDVATSSQTLDCRVYDAIDAFANSAFTGQVVIGVIDFYIYGFSASSARYDYIHAQWSWSHNMVGSTSGQFEPNLRVIESATGQSGDGMTFAISAPAKSGIPAIAGSRADQYVDFTLTQSWAYSGKLVIDYKLKLTQINQ